MARLDAPTAESAPSPDSEPCSHSHLAWLTSCIVEKWLCRAEFAKCCLPLDVMDGRLQWVLLVHDSTGTGADLSQDSAAKVTFN